MIAIADVLFVAVAYLVGSLPVVHLLARRHGVDLRAVGSRSVGVTNLIDYAGPLAGLAGVGADLLKGLSTTLAAQAFGFGPYTVAASGIAAVVGQMWPVFLRLHGGRGNLTTLGVMCVLAPAVLLVGAVPVVLGAVLEKLQRRSGRPRADVFGGALGVFTGVVTATLFVWVADYRPALAWGVTTLAALLLLRRVTAASLGGQAAPHSLWAVFCTRLLWDRPRL
jgi:glycerol-3-phosphate acyltransferase PlsY